MTGTAQFECEGCGGTWDPAKQKIAHKRNPIPDKEQLEEWTFDSECEATDGCTTERDGWCEHGHPSWLLALGMI